MHPDHPAWGRRRAAVWGIVNVTPDSFFDGGVCLDPAVAAAQAARMVACGADALDVGGESTRPGSDRVTAGEELARVIPAIRAIRADTTLAHVPISIDTTKAEVAEAALDVGATIVNDISALRFDAAMAPLVARLQVPVVLMHTLADPKVMQVDPRYPRGVVPEILDFFRERLAFGESVGISPEQVILDVGFGFGKTTRHNLELLAHMANFVALGRPVMIGTSRKSFIGRVLGGEASPLPPNERLVGTLATQVVAWAAGARVFRVHDVAEAVQCNRMVEAVAAVGGEPTLAGTEKSL